MAQAAVVHDRAARVAVAACAAHAAIFIALHVLEPQLSPVSSIISDYATGQPAVTTAAFVVFAVVWVSLALALGAAPTTPTLFAGRALFVLAAVAIVVAAVLPESADPRGGGALAGVQNFLARPGLFLAVVLASFGLRRAPGSSGTSNVLMVLAVAALLGLILTVTALLAAGYGGVGQRLLFLLLYAWVWLAAKGVLPNGVKTA